VSIKYKLYNFVASDLMYYLPPFSGNRSSYDGFSGNHSDGSGGLPGGDGGVNSLDQLNAMEKSLSDQVGIYNL